MLDQRRKQLLDAMGIRRWVRRDLSVDALPESDSASPEQSITTAPVQQQPATDWEALRAQVAACEKCALHASRTQTVFGTGDRNADLLIIGEAPGADEDRLGEPFVGRAGQLLDQMLLAAGFRRNQVYIANILKCRPPDNRNPAPEEIRACSGYLASQISMLQPKAILSVGGVSATSLLETDQSVGKLRGEVHDFGESRIPLVVTYHPAYLLRKPAEKAKSWIDLQLLMRVLRGVA
ncbi:MAG: uracil-DNA glycosylase [Gammaproteobacteria bacterium]|jgi:uracil-DNA glycosylase